jgi:ArsR family transcriptional regulator
MDIVAKKRPKSGKSRTRSAASAEELAAIAKALGHPARIHIVRLLLEKQSCIGCAIVDEVGLAQSTVSEHLRILKAAGIISGEIERPRVCYSLNIDRLTPLTELLNTIFKKEGAQRASWLEPLPALRH